MNTKQHEEIGQALAAFKEIKGDVFVRATKAAIDMAAVLDIDPHSAAVQVGKALSDPLAGMAALSKSGVSFGMKASAMVRSFVETGRMMEAQGIILWELESKYGGAAEAIDNTFFGAKEKARFAIEEAVEVIRPMFIPQAEAMIRFILRNLIRLRCLFGWHHWARSPDDGVKVTHACRDCRETKG